MTRVEEYPLEAADPYCLDAATSVDLLRGAPWRRLAVLGDSVAEGIGEPLPGYRDQPWCDRVAAELQREQPDLRYLNVGRRFLRAAEVRAEQLGPVLRFRPDLAIVVAGGNDTMSRSYDPDISESHIVAIVTALRAAGADVVTVGLFDIGRVPGEVGLRWLPVRDRLLDLSARTAALAARHGAIHLDLTSHPASRDGGIYAGDGIHCNARGHAIAAAATVRALGAHLRAVTGPARR